MPDYFLDVALIALFPNLLPYPKNVNLSLKGAMAVENVLDLFRLLMSRPDYEEFFETAGSFEFFTGCTIAK